MAQTRDLFDRVLKATGSALDRAANSAGGETDRNLMLYEKMDRGKFELLIRKYGQESVMGYIKTMEARKMNKR